jgi:hypothetical protein
MSKEYADYPKGKFSIQGGELQDVFDVNCTFEDGETTVHTFKNKGEACGSTSGKRKAAITFKSSISEAGFERDYLGNWRKRRVINGRMKVPGKTISVTGRLTKPALLSNLDGFIEFSVTLEGKSTES